jgi:hypothetical protein
MGSFGGSKIYDINSLVCDKLVTNFFDAFRRFTKDYYIHRSYELLTNIYLMYFEAMFPYYMTTYMYGCLT